MLDRITINQLRTFIAMCEETSFTGAARHLRPAQSAVSRAISALETALGLELFERDARRAELTAAGRSLIPDVRAVIARTEEVKNRAKSISAKGVPRAMKLRTGCSLSRSVVVAPGEAATLLAA
jgi:DNA-binding transcriptional LysR family regulator